MALFRALVKIINLQIISIIMATTTEDNVDPDDNFIAGATVPYLIAGCISVPLCLFVIYTFARYKVRPRALGNRYATVYIVHIDITPNRFPSIL